MAVFLSCLAWAAAGCSPEAGDPAPAAVEAGHHDHPAAAAAVPASLEATAACCEEGHGTGREDASGACPHPEFRVVRAMIPPDDFLGNLAYDRESGRLWLVGLGPPANLKGPSVLYEVDPATCEVIARAELPFLGEFGAPVFIDGYLYQGVHHESKLYKIEVNDRSRFGQVVRTVPLPTYLDIELEGDDPRRFPFIAFKGATATPDGQLMIHAEGIGEFITIDKDTGKVLRRVKTVHALGGISRAAGPDDAFLVVANSDPANAALKAEMGRFMFRGEHGITPISSDRASLNCRRPDEKLINWVLTDGTTGEALAVTSRVAQRELAESIAVVDHQPIDGHPYGRYTMLAIGRDEILTLEWTP